jgi:predicted MFS family arabinose efflux permease
MKVRSTVGVETLEPASVPRAVRQALFALSCAAFLVNLDRAIFAPLLPALAHDLHSTIAGTGLAVTFYVIPYGLFQLLYGPLGDRSGKVAVVRWVVLLFAVGTGLCGAVGGVAMLYILRAATGACAAAVIPLALAYIGDVVPYGQRQGAIAALMGFTALGNVLSTAVGGIVGDFLSWRALFGLYGVCALGVAALLFRVPAERPEGRPVHRESSLQRYLAVVRVGQARHLYVLVALEGIFVTGGFTYLGAFLRARFGISYLAIGLILACYAGGTLLTSRYVLRRRLLPLSERQLIVAGGICLGGGFLALQPLATPLLAPLPILLMGVGFALFHSTLQTRATELSPGRRGTAVALFAFSLFLGGGAGTAALGAVLSFSGYPLLLAISGVGMLAVTLYARLAW